MTFPLSKILDPERDYPELAPELEVVDRHFHSASEQHPHRRFEYGMALRALRGWNKAQGVFDGAGEGSYLGGMLMYDVGGAGSPFLTMLKALRPERDHRLIDPTVNLALADYIRMNKTPLGHAVFCLSVLEHVDDLDQFLWHLSCLTAPGGLLFLTMDCCNCPSHEADTEVPANPDLHHFRWMRQRMFGQADIRYVAEALLDFDFTWLGERDFTYSGHSVYDYAFCSMAMVKRA